MDVCLSDMGTDQALRGGRQGSSYCLLPTHVNLSMKLSKYASSYK
jgi:hypothetical protein